MVGGVLLLYNQIPYLLSGWPTNWKIILSQRLFHRSESPEPQVRFPSLGVWHQQEEPPEICHWWLAGLEWRSCTGLGETTPFLKSTHKVSCALGPRAKQWLHKNLYQTYLWAWEGLLGRQGSGMAPCTGKALEVEAPGSNHWHELPRRLPFWKWNLAPPNRPQAPVHRQLRSKN